MAKETHVVIDWSDVKKEFLMIAEGKPMTGVNRQHHSYTSWVEKAKNAYGPPKCSHSCKVAKSDFEDGMSGGYCKHQRRERERFYNEKTRRYDFRYTEPCAYCVWNGQNSFEGGSIGSMFDYLRNGYRAPEFEHSAAYVPMADQKHPRWSEEADGEIDLGRLYGGYDEFYLVPADEEKKPGVRVMIEFAFACGVSPKTIEKYGAWVAGLLGALEASGYDLTVDLWTPLDNLFVGVSGRHNVLTRVKRENEVSDFTEWSALFSPTGYRHLGFMAKLVAGNRAGYTCNSSLGTTLGGFTWGLDYDKEESILKIRVDQRGHHNYGGDPFPVEKLNKQAVDLGLIPEAVKR
jgi:hypothetical protein